jgi:chorismate dehydratase
MVRSVSRSLTGAALGHVGCVSYLNARPLIDQLDDRDDLKVRFDVPSRLLDDLMQGSVDIALCPVIDYLRHPDELEIVPVGGIGSDGPTLTVRLYSRVPIEQVHTIYADTDSHSSVVLVRVIMREMFNVEPKLIDYHAREQVADNRPVTDPQAMLLIGDKVITAAPDESVSCHQLDLGEAWRKLHGLPFVFAVWMCRRGAKLGDLPRVLDEQRVANLKRINDIADRAAPVHHWPQDLAREYLGRIMRYTIGAKEIEAIERFGHSVHELGLINEPGPLRLRNLL